MPTTWNAIFLGNFGTSIDPTEGSAESENASSFVGQTFGSDADRLAKHVVSVQTIDNGGGSGLDTDRNTSVDQIRFDLGGGQETTVFDGNVVYNATLTYTDDTTANITAVVFQDENGNLFLAPELSSNADSAAMEAKAIKSLTLGSVISNFSDLATNRLLTNFVCYAPGSMILTDQGERAVETLQVGDRLITRDHGDQPIRWIGHRHLTFPNGADKRKPIEIKAGALGPGTPDRTLIVSPQHRMLMAGCAVQDLFGEPEVLALAKGLTVLNHIRQMKGKREVILRRIESDSLKGIPTAAL